MEDGTKSTRVTIRTVAQDAGVSVSAVSKVLRDAYGVSDDLRKRVNISISRLGYRPSMAARSMRGRTHTVGILLVEMENPFLPVIVSGIMDELSEANYKSMLAVGRADMMIETSLIDSMLDFRMDGIILVAPRLKGALLSKYAKQIPTVVVGHHEPESTDFDTVNGNDVEAMRQIVRRVHRDGRRRIEMVSIDRSTNDSDVSYQREVGYTAEMTALGLAEHIRINRLSEQHKREAIAPLVARPDQPEAYICWSDLHGIDLVSQGRAKGWRIPSEIAVVGFDDSPAAALPQIDLASYNHDGTRQGAEATRLLLSRIDGRTDARHVLVDGKLIERSSLTA